MKDLQPYASEYDKWIYSLLEMLRTKYFDVEVLRGRKKYKFIYAKKWKLDIWLFSFEYWIKKRKSISKITLDEHFQNKTTPQRILDLL